MIISLAIEALDNNSFMLGNCFVSENLFYSNLCNQKNANQIRCEINRDNIKDNFGKNITGLFIAFTHLLLFVFLRNQFVFKLYKNASQWKFENRLNELEKKRDENNNKIVKFSLYYTSIPTRSSPQSNYTAWVVFVYEKKKK